MFDLSLLKVRGYTCKVPPVRYASAHQVAHDSLAPYAASKSLSDSAVTGTAALAAALLTSSGSI